MTLLTIVSKQIWPHVLAVAHLKPTSLILLHSEDRNESYLPAQRIKKLIETTGLLPKGNVARLRELEAGEELEPAILGHRPKKVGTTKTR